jgi:beta-glucanase (GH16 family)
LIPRYPQSVPHSARLAIALLAVLPACAAPPLWNLVWSDDFTGPAGSAPDPAKWSYDLGGGGWGNQELEVYTDSRNNSYLDGQGNLVIAALHPGAGQYTSARLKTQSLFTTEYGRVEARIKIPRGQGLWPAFWMLGDNIGSAGWPPCGEIDIMENIGREPATVHGTVHGPGYSGGQGISQLFSLASGAFADDYHVYAIEWAPQRIDFFVDDHQYFTVTPASLPGGTQWVFDHPFFLLLNVAVGGSWPGSPDAATVFPQKMPVDYVRVYHRAKRWFKTEPLPRARDRAKR